MYNENLHTCNINRDGIDTDVLHRLPTHLIKKLARKANIKVSGYNDALKHAIKARAGVEGKRLRDFIMEVPGIEAHVIQIEKMMKGGELKRVQPTMVKLKTPVKDYVDIPNPAIQSRTLTANEDKRPLSSLKSLKQQGGSIINDLGKEQVLMPKNEGTELDPMEYLQNYVRSTTLGKYKNGGKTLKRKLKK